MTCKDCIHFTDEIINDKYHLCDAYKTIGGTDRQDAWAVSSTDGGCKLFENNDGTYSNGTWHCPRCGVPVSKWGLCMDCEILYVAPKRKTVPLNLKVENIYKHESDFSDIDDDIEEIEDSWESVSK